VYLTLFLSVASADPISAPAELSPIARALTLRPQVETLENGLTIVLHEDHRSPKVHLTTLVRVGSADDPADASGLVHLFEHLMFKGSPNAQGTEWGRLLEEAGASAEAWTERDWTLYQSSGPASSLERLLFLESDRFGWMTETVTEDAIALEHGVIQNERASRDGGDQQGLYSRLHSLLWPPDHPYHRPVLGLAEHDANLATGRISTLASEYYRPANAILVLSGDFQRDIALEQIRSAYSLIERRGARVLRAYPERPRRGVDVRKTWTVQGGPPLLLMGWNTPPWGHPDLPKLRLVVAILRARAAQMEGIAFNAKPDVALRARRAGGELVVRLVSDGTGLETLLERFDRELTDLAFHGPSQQELDRARMRWQAAAIERLENPSAIGLAMARCVAVHENPDCLSPEMQSIESVTPQQIQAAIRTHLNRDRVFLSRVTAEHLSQELPDSEPLK